jgi:DNA-binding transcriptional LysR family regulator
MVAEPQQATFAWDDVRVLLAMVRAPTLRGAGARLGLNASTVGRRLDALEAGLGVRLFDRTPDGLRITAAGERLVPHAERLEQAAVGVADAVSGLEQEVEGVVRLSAPPGVADQFIAPALPRLYRRYPRLRIDLDAAVAYADLTRREADLALRASLSGPGQDLVAVKLVDQPDAILGAPALVERLGPLAALADAPWIGWGRELAHIPGAKWLAEQVPESTIRLRTSSMGAQLTAAELGVGLLVLPRAHRHRRKLVEARLAPGLAARLPPLPREQLWMVGHRALREVPRIAAVWSFVREELSRM